MNFMRIYQASEAMNWESEPDADEQNARLKGYNIMYICIMIACFQRFTVVLIKVEMLQPLPSNRPESIDFE